MGKHQYQNERIRKGDCIGTLDTAISPKLDSGFLKKFRK